MHPEVEVAPVALDLMELFLKEEMEELLQVLPLYRVQHMLLAEVEQDLLMITKPVVVELQVFLEEDKEILQQLLQLVVLLTELVAVVEKQMILELRLAQMVDQELLS
jgi:hypothetical protein